MFSWKQTKENCRKVFWKPKVKCYVCSSIYIEFSIGSKKKIICLCVHKIFLQRFISKQEFLKHLLCTRRWLGPPSRLCSLSRAPRGEYFPAFQHPQGCPGADWHGWSPRGEAEAPGGRECSPGGKMKTESWADTGRPKHFSCELT